LLRLEDLKPAPYDDAHFEGDRLLAVVIHVNRFGNCMLNILEKELRTHSASIATYQVVAGAKCVKGVPHASTFSSVDLGMPLLYPDSYGRIAIALNQGNAAETLGLKLGSVIELFR
jgi:S-adenosylmethionine hydrolase